MWLCRIPFSFINLRLIPLREKFLTDTFTVGKISFILEVIREMRGKNS